LGWTGIQQKRNSTMVPVLSGYFETMGGRILYGREFTDAEVRAGTKVAVVMTVCSAIWRAGRSCRASADAGANHLGK